MVKIMPDNDVVLSILTLLNKNAELRPLEMLAEMKKSGFSQADTKEAMSYLIHSQQIEFTSDRALRAMSHAA